MIKKRWLFYTFTWLLLYFIPISISAEQRKYLNIHLKSGNNVYFSLSENPKITISRGVLTISTESFQLSNISKYTLEVEVPEVSSIRDMEDLFYSLDEKIAYVTTSKDNENIMLYSLDGKNLPTQIIFRNGNRLGIDLSRYQAGVYLLRIGSETLQIVLP